MMGAQPQPATDSQEMALKQYDALLRYLAYENTVYWTRCQFFLFASIGLLGLSAAKFPAQHSAATPVAVLVLASILAVGFCLTALWLVILRKAEIWIARWSVS